ncbi:MAG: peptidyl-prolyl cis-trans isomerase, partial [Lysobacteraceae bacterium]
MFDFIRKHSKMVMIVLFLLIIPSFVLVGSLDRYSLFDGQGDTVATVDGQAIKRVEWDTAHQREMDRVRMSNPQVDAAMLDSPEARYYSLENLVRERVLAAAAAKSMLVTSDGKRSVNAARYREIVGSQNMTPAMYEARLRSDMSMRQVLGGVANTAFVPDALANAALESYFGRREIQVHRFSAADFVTRAAPTDADLETYYKAHESRYRTPESASIEYVVLDAEAVKAGISVNEQDLRTYYEQNLAAQAATEQRRVSHIMVESPASASAADRAKAKARAEELLAQVRKTPASFADVAKKESQDPGSAANGGDLDFAARGGFVSKALEQSAFALKNKGDISDVVESEFGYHVVRLTDVRAPAVKSFEQSRPTLEAEYRAQQAQRLFSETAEQFTNTVYE